MKRVVVFSSALLFYVVVPEKYCKLLLFIMLIAIMVMFKLPESGS